MGDTNDEWKKMRPVVELSVVQPSHSSRKSIRKRQSLTTSSDGSVQRMTPKDHAQEPVQSETGEWTYMYGSPCLGLDVCCSRLVSMPNLWIF